MQVAISPRFYWLGRLSSRMGENRLKEGKGGDRYLSPLQSLLQNMKICCKIQVIIHPLFNIDLANLYQNYIQTRTRTRRIIQCLITNDVIQYKCPMIGKYNFYHWPITMHTGLVICIVRRHYKLQIHRLQILRYLWTKRSFLSRNSVKSNALIKLNCS